MFLGTAVWAEGPVERRALVARLVSGRLADVNRIEAVRLRKLGEGDPERLADALVPASLRRVLEGGVRALARVKQTVAYAEKWDRRGTLPEFLAPSMDSVRQLPCLPRPALLRGSDGNYLDRFRVLGPGAEVQGNPSATLAVVGAHGGRPFGFCLATLHDGGVVLGGWLMPEWPKGEVLLKTGIVRRHLPFSAWEGIELPDLRTGEVLLLPLPHLKPLPNMVPGAEFILEAPFEELRMRLGPDAVHGSIQ